MDDLLDTKTIVSLLIAIAGIVMIFVGIQVVGGSKRAQYSDTMRTGFNAGVGLVLIAVGAVAGVVGLIGRRVLEFLGYA